MKVDRTDSGEAPVSKAASSRLTLVRAAGVTVIALMVANCSQGVRSGIDPKYGVAASPRIVRDGEPVPKGGGRAMVGKPYTVAGKTYVPSDNPHYVSEGFASWYGSNFHGRMTANGEIFDRASIAAAHTTMPLPSYARVTNLQNGYSMIVRVNDRGPYHANRVMDVSERAAEALGFKRQGTARVRVEYVGRASVNGSDDRILLASLRTDGAPASLSTGKPTMLAEATPRPAFRETIAVRSYDQTSDEDGPSEAPQRISGNVATLATPRPANNIPLPPERPFDLGTIPGAATPIKVSAETTMPPARPVVAGLYYAAEEGAHSFQKGAAFGVLDQARFVSRSAQN